MQQAKKAPYRVVVFSRLGIRGRQHYFRVVSSHNGLVVAQSEGYRNRRDCVDTVANLINGFQYSYVDLQS